jgi:hypothetical protein
MLQDEIVDVQSAVGCLERLRRNEGQRWWGLCTSTVRLAGLATTYRVLQMLTSI